jgi:ribosome modulation factor
MVVDGMSTEDCPYEEGTDSYEDWMWGYNDASYDEYPETEEEEENDRP